MKTTEEAKNWRTQKQHENKAAAKIAAGKKAALAKRAGTVSAKGVSAKTNRSTTMATKKPTPKKTATPKSETVDIDREQLLALGAELNTLLFEGSEVEYEELDDEALEAQIRQDCTEIDPADKFSDEAKAIIAELDIDIAWAAPKKDTGEKPVATPKAKKETAPAKEKKVKADSGYTRSHALVDALEANSGSTREQIVAAADKLYVKNGGKTNPNVSNYMFGYVAPSLLILGIIEQEGKAFTWIGK